MKTSWLAGLVLALATACAADGNDRPVDATGPDATDLPDASEEPPDLGETTAPEVADSYDPADLPSPADTFDVSSPGCRTGSPAELAAFERTLVVACWDGEELGLLGSAAYAERARAEGDDLVAVYTLDMIGYVDATPGAQEMPPELQLLAPAAYKEVQEGGAKGDFLAILADPAHLKAANLFATYATEAGSKTYVLKIPDALKLADETADLRNSDHAAFWEAGFSALAVSDTGPLRNPYLHCAGGPDTIATLDVAFAVGATRGLVGSAAEVLGLREAHPER